MISSYPNSIEGDVREDNVEQEISGQSSLSDTLGDRLTTRNLLIEYSRKTSIDGQRDCTSECTNDQDFSSWHSIGETDGNHGSDARYDRVEEIVGELLGDTGYAEVGLLVSLATKSG
jgi:hypothetical protein